MIHLQMRTSNATMVKNDHSVTTMNEPGIESKSSINHSTDFMDAAAQDPGIHERDGMIRSVRIEIIEALIMRAMNGMTDIEAMIPIGQTIPK